MCIVNYTVGYDERVVGLYLFLPRNFLISCCVSCLAAFVLDFEIKTLFCLLYSTSDKFKCFVRRRLVKMDTIN